MADSVEPTNDETIIERLVDEFADLCARGTPPDIPTFARRHPDLEDQLRDLLPVVLQMHQCAAGTATVEPDRPRELGDYQILREIGRGGMGVVYEAHQKSLGRRVALKVLPSSLPLTGRQELRFELESRAAARLHHSNIVPVFGVGEQDGVKYYVMQFIDGCGLDEVLRELQRRRQAAGRARDPGHADNSSTTTDGILATAASTAAPEAADPEAADRSAIVAAAASYLLSGSTLTTRSRSGSAVPSAARDSSAVAPRERDRRSSLTDSYIRSIVQIGIATADALQYAHSQGVIHRDVKPSNLMLDVDGQIWIMDFGLAKAADGHEVTRTGDVVGTLRYMAPERFHGESDARSDIYSLALTLYELLLLQPAFPASDRAELIRQLTSRTPLRPRRIHPDFPQDLETILLQAMEQTPDRRYTQAGDLRDDLISFLEGRSIAARRASPRDRILKWIRREPVVASLTGLVGLLVLIAVAGISSQWRAAVLARNAAQKNLQEANRHRAAADAAKISAEENLQRAIQAVDEMLTSVAREELNGVPRMDRMRRDLLEDALAILQELLHAAPASRMLQFETARAYSRVSDICRLLGSYGDAETSSDKAIALLTRLVTADGDAAAYSLQLATTLNHRGQLADLLADGTAEEWFQRAVDLRSDISVPAEDRPERDRALAGDLVELGTILTRKRRFSAADPLFEKAITLCETLLQETPDSVDALVQLADACSNHGILKRRRNRTTDAVRLYERALEIRRWLVDAHPDRPELIESLAISYNNLGFVQRLRRRRDLALPLYQRSLELREQLTRDHPDVPSYRKRLAFACAVLARITADKDSREELLQRAFDIRLRLTREFPRNPDHWNDLSLVHGNLTELLTDAGRDAEAEELADRLAEAHQEYLGVVEHRLTLAISRDNADADASTALIGSFIDRADELRLTGDSRRALPLFAEALQKVDALREESDSDATLLNSRARVHYSWSLALRDLALLQNAETHAQHAISDLGAAINLGPARADDWVRLAAAWQYHASLLEALGTSEQASESLRQAVAVRKSLADQFPESEDYQADLAQMHRETAAQFQLAGHHEQAKAALDEAVTICRTLSGNNPDRRAWRRDLAESLYDRGLLLCLMHRADAGLADLEAATQLTRALLKEKSLYRAQHCLTANQLAWELLICADAERRDAERALQLSEEVTALLPADGDYQNTLGVAQMRLRQFSAARRTLEQAIQLRGGTALDYYPLASVLFQLDRPEDARYSLQQATRWDATNDWSDPGLPVLKEEALALEQQWHATAGDGIQ